MKKKKTSDTTYRAWSQGFREALVQSFIEKGFQNLYSVIDVYTSWRLRIEAEGGFKKE